MISLNLVYCSTCQLDLFASGVKKSLLVENKPAGEWSSAGFDTAPLPVTVHSQTLSASYLLGL